MLGMNHFWKYVKETLSENGTFSWGRVASSVFGVAGMIWVTKLIIHNGTMPDLAGLTAFIIAPYAANRATTAVQSFSNNPATLTQTGTTPAAPSQLAPLPSMAPALNPIIAAPSVVVNPQVPRRNIKRKR